jgi:hypothetical protein
MHKFWIEMRGRGGLFGRVEIASVEVLPQSDGVSKGFLIEVEGSIVEHYLNGGVLMEDARPELPDDRTSSESLFPPIRLLV